MSQADLLAGQCQILLHRGNGGAAAWSAPVTGAWSSRAGDGDGMWSFSLRSAPVVRAEFAEQAAQRSPQP